MDLYMESKWNGLIHKYLDWFPDFEVVGHHLVPCSHFEYLGCIMLPTHHIRIADDQDSSLYSEKWLILEIGIGSILMFYNYITLMEGLSQTTINLVNCLFYANIFIGLTYVVLQKHIDGEAARFFCCVTSHIVQAFCIFILYECTNNRSANNVEYTSCLLSKCYQVHYDYCSGTKQAANYVLFFFHLICLLKAVLVACGMFRGNKNDA